MGVKLERMFPLYEAKMIHHYDTRWATFEPDGSTRDVTPAEKQDPNFYVMPRYWVSERDFAKRLPPGFRDMGYVGFRDIARVTDARTIIDTLVPLVPVGNKLPLIFSANGRFIQAALSSFAFDYAMRQKMGGTTLNFFYMQQLPMPTPKQIQAWRPFIEDRVDRLNARPRPGVNRDALRAELDAAAFHILGIPRDEVDYIMETFPIVKRKDVEAHGSYRTKELILAAYDALASPSATTGVPK